MLCWCCKAKNTRNDHQATNQHKLWQSESSDWQHTPWESSDWQHTPWESSDLQHTSWDVCTVDMLPRWAPSLCTIGRVYQAGFNLDDVQGTYCIHTSKNYYHSSAIFLVAESLAWRRHRLHNMLQLKAANHLSCQCSFITGLLQQFIFNAHFAFQTSTTRETTTRTHSNTHQALKPVPPTTSSNPPSVGSHYPCCWPWSQVIIFYLQSSLHFLFCRIIIMHEISRWYWMSTPM